MRDIPDRRIAHGSRDDATTAVMKLLQAARAERRRDIHRAIELANDALSIAEPTGNRRLVAETLAVLGPLLGSRSERATGVEYLRRARAIYAKLRDRPARARADTALAQIMFDDGRLDAALALLRRATAVFRAGNDERSLASARKITANVLRAAGRFPEALDELFAALAYFEAVGDPLETGQCLHAIGLVYRAVRDHERALEFFRRSLAPREAAGDVIGTALTLGSIGGTYVGMRDPASGIPYLIQRVRLLADIAGPGRNATAWSDLGAAHEMLGHESEALRCYRKATRFALLDGNRPTVMINISGNIGRVHRRMGRYAAALKAFHHVAELAVAVGEPRREMEVMLEISETYRAMGDPDRANAAYVEYVERRDGLMGTATTRAIVELEYRARLKEMEAREQERDEQIRRLQQELQRERIELAAATVELLQRNEQIGKLAPAHAANGRARSATPNEWTALTRRLVATQNDFHQQLIGACAALTPTELKVCSLVRAGLSTKDISAVLYVDDRTVETHRSNARRKLNVPRGTSLAVFLARLE